MTFGITESEEEVRMRGRWRHTSLRESIEGQDDAQDWREVHCKGWSKVEEETRKEE
jgi:hypothetical protein